MIIQIGGGQGDKEGRRDGEGQGDKFKVLGVGMLCVAVMFAAWLAVNTESVSVVPPIIISAIFACKV